MKLAIQFAFLDGGPNNFGLFRRGRYNRAPKPSYFTLQRVCSLLSSPAELYKPDWSVKVTPDRYFPSKNWKWHEPMVVWDGDELKPLGNVQKHLYKNGDNELIIVLWNAIRATDERMPLLTENIIVGTTEYANPLAIDIMTGETYDIKSKVKGNKTFLKDVVIPDYPIVIKMFRK